MGKMPFADLLPGLSRGEFEALKADIKANGVKVPIEVDEDGNILDGHNRYRIDKTAKTVTVRGLTEAEKEAHVYRANRARRNLSPEQERDLRKAMKATAKKLREQDAKKYTQKDVAATLGVAQQTVSDWFAKPGTITETGIASAPDARVKVPPAERPKILERVSKGETQEQVADDYKVSPRQVRTIVTREKKQQAREDRQGRFG
jgi:ParB-like chromosome segregation protein Spo0J